MSPIRRLKAIAKLEAEVAEARDSRWNKLALMDTLIQRINRLRPRGSDNPISNVMGNVINTQHYGAAQLLQKLDAGQTVATTWESKRGNHLESSYVRQGWRPNVSRKWLPKDARI